MENVPSIVFPAGSVGLGDVFVAQERTLFDEYKFD